MTTTKDIKAKKSEKMKAIEKNILLKGEILALRDACEGCPILKKCISSLPLDSIKNGHVIMESIIRENTTLGLMIEHCHVACSIRNPDYKVNIFKKE